MANDDSLWLVKSSGRILGPFTTLRVTELLRSREVSVLDEVAAPARRWQTIQYHEHFKEILERLRKTSLAETTDPTWTPSSGGTANVTQTLTDNLNSDLTDELTGDLSGFTNTAKEIVVHNVSEQPRPPSAPGAGRYQTAQGQNTAVRQQVEKTTRSLWILTALVLLAVAGFVVQKRMSSSSEARPTLATMKQLVVANVQAGQYQDALRLLKSFYPDPNQAGEMAIYYGSLLIQVEGQTTLGRRLLNNVISLHRPEVKQAFTGLGLADMLDGQLDSAQENFDKASGLDASYMPAVANSAAVALLRGDYARAKGLAVRALELSPMQGETLLTLAQAELYLFKSKSSSADLTRMGQSLRRYLSKQWDFSAELGFYELYFDFLRQDRALEEHLREYLDRDPQLTSDHRHNVFIYRGHTQWRALGRFCEQLTDSMGQGGRVSALLASCMAHETRWDLARKNIEKAVQLSSKDVLVQSWFSHILKESGDGDQASVVLARANELNRRGEYALPVLLQARFCQSKGDHACARDSWQRIYENNLESLPAISGMAQFHAEHGSRAEAGKLLEHGLKISPDYIPLLLLKQKAEREGWYVAN